MRDVTGRAMERREEGGKRESKEAKRGKRTATLMVIVCREKIEEKRWKRV